MTDETLSTKEVVGGILYSVKKQLGQPPESTEFDVDLIIHINSAINTLSQLGIGPEEGFIVESNDETYEDYLGEDYLGRGMVSLYIFYMTKLGFDGSDLPSTLVQLLNQKTKELEWRLMQLQQDLDAKKGGGDDGNFSP